MAHPENKNPKHVDDLANRCGPTNRPSLLAHIEQDRTNFRESSIRSWATAVVKADALLDGKDFRTLTPADCQRVLTAFRTVYSKAGLRLRAVSFRKHVRWLFGVDDLEKSDELGKKAGRAIEEALWVRREKEQVVGQVIADPDFQALLAAVKPRDSLGTTFPLDVRDRAMWSVLRASGFRIGEFASLNIGDVHLDGPTALLTLRRDAPDLKTGPRAVYITDGVPALKAWLSVHPKGGDKDAPLWVQASSRTVLRLRDNGIRKTLTMTLRWAGLDKKLPAILTPHDFRHSCATEKAELGWGEYQMCQYFGWEIGSRTPAIYVHLKLAKQRERILADAQRQAQAVQANPARAHDAVSALLDLVKQAAGQLGTPTAA